MPRARGRIASERVADFSQVLSPRVAARRRPTPSRHEQGLGRASARVAYCCTCNRRVWASGACAGLRASRASPQKTMKARGRVRIASPSVAQAWKHAFQDKNEEEQTGKATRETKIRSGSNVSVFPWAIFHRSQ